VLKRAKKYIQKHLLYMCRGKCRREEEIEEGDRNRERERERERETLGRKIQKRKKIGRHNNGALQSQFVCSWPVRNLKGRWDSL